MRRRWWRAGIATCMILHAALASAADSPSSTAPKAALAPRKPDPQRVSADEPLLRTWSPAKATEYLDKWASYHEGKKCLDCHETYAYLQARPYLPAITPRHAERRAAAEAYAEGLLKEQWPAEIADLKPVQRTAERRVTEALMTAVVLAQHDAATLGKLQKVSRDSLDGMWKLQRPDGAWHWLKTTEPPSATDDHYGAAMVAIGTGLAPDDYARTPAAQAGLERIRAYLKEHPPRHLHQRLLLMMAHKAIGGLMTPEERQGTVAELFKLQRPEGGWAMPSLADWKRIDKTPQDLTNSDGYGSGFSVYALRLAGDVPADDPRVRKAIRWIKTHQREGGYWYTRSPKINDAMSTYVGTSYVIMALHLCGELPKCATLAAAGAEEVLFRDAFVGKLGNGWAWAREDKSAWRIGDKGLEMRVMPGNLWGRANNVRNVLTFPLPDAQQGQIELSVTVANQPAHQWEQVNLAWYYDDSNMVKLGLELVDGVLCIVMGREEADKTRTLVKIPITATTVDLRLRVTGNQIQGNYRPTGSERWLDAATGELPVPPNGKAKASLHCYQGPADAERWVRFSEFQIKRLGDASTSRSPQERNRP